MDEQEIAFQDVGQQREYDEEASTALVHLSLTLIWTQQTGPGASQSPPFVVLPSLDVGQA